MLETERRERGRHRLSKLRARSGGETGQPDRCVYASVSQERRNLPELGRATSGLPGSFILCVATILERNRKEK